MGRTRLCSTKPFRFAISGKYRVLRSLLAPRRDVVLGVGLVDSGDPLLHEIDVLLRHHLVREDGGCEGFGAVEMFVDVDNLAVAHPEVEVKARIDLDAAPFAESGYVGSNDDVVASRNDVVKVDLL